MIEIFAENENGVRLKMFQWKLLIIGAAAASRLYVDAVGKLGRQAQQGTWGGCADIGRSHLKYFF